jgi:hypothetical protein
MVKFWNAKRSSVFSLTYRKHYSQEKSPWYPLNRMLGGPQRRSGRGGEEKNSQPLPGLEPLITQPIAQHCNTERKWHAFGRSDKESVKMKSSTGQPNDKYLTRFISSSRFHCVYLFTARSRCFSTQQENNREHWWRDSCDVYRFVEFQPLKTAYIRACPLWRCSQITLWLPCSMNVHTKVNRSDSVDSSSITKEERLKSQCWSSIQIHL